MDDRATKAGAGGVSLSTAELMLWVAALAAMLGLIEESIGAVVVPYVVYLGLSVRIFWAVPRAVVPTTILIASVLWTLALHLIGRVGMLQGVAMLVVVPFATASAIWRLFPQIGEPDEGPGPEEAPSTARALLLRGRGFGVRSSRAKPAGEPEI